MNENALFDALLQVATAEALVQKGENYVYRNADSEIVGVLRVLSSGKFVVAVRGDHQKQGVGTALLKAANEISAIDFSKSTYTQAGERLRDSYLKTQGQKENENGNTNHRN